MEKLELEMMTRFRFWRLLTPELMLTVPPKYTAYQGFEEYKIIWQVVDIINENTAIPCTNCRYCEKDYPKNIAIPDYFALQQ